MYKKVVIGIDESYTRTGISVAADGKLLKVKSVDFKGCKNKSDKRNLIRKVLIKLINSIQQRTNSELIIILERIRTFTGGNKLRPKYLISTGALIATIVDIAYEYGVKVYSVDTRSWKAQVVGSSKKSKGDPKLLTIRHICKLGFEADIAYENTKGELKYNDDAADSACIALYGFIPIDKQILRLEE